MSNLYPIFSVPIKIVDIDNIDNVSIINYSKECNEKKLSSDIPKNKFFDWKNENLIKLNTAVEEEANKLFSELGYNSDDYDFKITNGWCNVGVDVTLQVPHIHRNSFFSAVYYAEAQDGSINLLNPNQAIALTHKDEKVIKTPNFFNGDVTEFYPKTGSLIMFPSYLYHYVKNTNMFRCSIAYELNIFDKNGVQHQ